MSDKSFEKYMWTNSVARNNDDELRVVRAKSQQSYASPSSDKLRFARTDSLKSYESPAAVPDKAFGA